MKTVWRVLGYLKKYPGLTIGNLSCAVLTAAAIVIAPLLTEYIIDNVIGGHRPQLLAPCVALGLIAFLAQDSLNGLRIYLNALFQQRVIFDIRSSLFRHMESLPVRWYDNRTLGDISTRLIGDVEAVERIVTNGIEEGAVPLLRLVAVISALFYFSGSRTWYVLLPIPLLAANTVYYTLTAFRRHPPERAAASGLNSVLLDQMGGIRQIKSFVCEDQEHKRFNYYSRALQHASMRIMRAWAFYMPAMSFLNSLGVMIAITLGGHAVLQGEMQIGALAAFIALTQFLYEPIEALHGYNRVLQAGRAAADRVFEVMDECVEPGAQSGSHIKSAKGDIRYKDVSFAYSSGAPVLSNISFHAAPGEKVAIVGPTGAGKSTIANLLVRFYEPASGSITLDGYPLSELGVSSLRRLIGVVSQETFLFNGSIRDNLLFGKAGLTDVEIWGALGTANADRFVQRLSDGLDSKVGEHGVKLSTGEKQRISIARALLKDPPIMILDEATSSVDSGTEEVIQAALDNLLEQRTCLVIAHRLSTILGADEILVLDAGRIRERGKHRDLLGENGLYSRLYESFLKQR